MTPVLYGAPAPALFGGVLIRRHRITVGTRGTAELAFLNGGRTAFRHPAPARQPTWSAYGPAGAAFSVALFGRAAMWAVDPMFTKSVTERPPPKTETWTPGGPSCGDACGGCGGL